VQLKSSAVFNVACIALDEGAERLLAVFDGLKNATQQQFVYFAPAM
jgi:hypothetical protein